MKTFSSKEKLAIKRTAQNVDKYVTKKQKLLAKIEEFNKELEEINIIIDEWETPIKRITGGFTTTDLINKVLESYTNKEGEVIKKNNFIFKYPDTIIPVEEVTEEQKAEYEAMQLNDAEAAKTNEFDF